MKYLKLTAILLLLSSGVFGQATWTNVGNGLQQRIVSGVTQYRFVKTPAYPGYYNITDSLNAIALNAGTPTSRTLAINGVSYDLTANRAWTVVSNLALGTPTTTTYPITNSNGTGFTLPAATTSLAGLLVSSDKTKLDALSTSSISSPTKADINVIPSSGFRSFIYSASTNGAPTAGSGLGFETIRTSATTNGYFAFANANGGADLYFRTGAGTTSFNSWDIVAGRTWVSGLYAPLASPVGTGIASWPQYKLTALNTAPASATATGTLGEIRITADFIFICTAANTWKRVAISTW